MKIQALKELAPAEFNRLLRRPVGDVADPGSVIASILRKVEIDGDKAIREMTLEFDGVDLARSAVTDEEFRSAEHEVRTDVRVAIESASDSLRAFHRPQVPGPVDVVTRPGVRCRLEWRPIQRVGLYVPGGTTPLISTVLMLGIPAILAQCPEIVLCTPPGRDGAVSPDLLVAAKSLGLKSIFKVGGAQAIAAMALGTETIPKAGKIFGPGNRFVTMMKSLVARPPYNVAIDMLAGPSELLIIADDSANANWVAADLLSQAEHGADSPVIMMTASSQLANDVAKEISLQSSELPRRSIATRALDQGCILLVGNLGEAIEFSNVYAPEHLMLAVNDAESLTSRITNAGSVFVNSMTSVVFGDYASGTNHTLPTNGLAGTFGGLTVRDFLKPMFFQTVDAEGLRLLSPTVKSLARAEGLEGHARAIEVRERI